jgi:hypothetical protein
MVRARFPGPTENSGEQRKLSRFWKWTLGSFLGLLVAVFVGLSFMAGSPKDVYGLVRYALPHMHRGKLRAGDDAPDVRLLSLDGSNRFHLRERTGSRPLVVVFGSYT